VRAVLRQDRDARARWKPERPQVRSHAPRLVERFSPRDVDHLPATDGLGQQDAVRMPCGMLEHVVDDQSLLIHLSPSRSAPAAGDAVTLSG